jgi:PhzF family phenazine biosynthesis protein
MLSLIQSLSNTLVQLLHPLLEISVFETGNNAPIATYHRFEANIPAPQTVDEPVLAQTSDGRTVKVISFPFVDSRKSYIVQFRADISIFTALHQQLSQIIQQPITTNLPGKWQQQITDNIQHYLNEQQISLAGLSRHQKRQVTFYLKQKGLLDYKEATTYLAKTLNTSRATIYNYLNSAEKLTHLTIHQVNSFSDKPEGGNPAGVVLEAENIDTASMQGIARELNYSETAFLVPSKKADFQLRYFSRDGSEVKFCGHSTVGTLYMLAKEKHYDMTVPGEFPFKIETHVGMINSLIHIDSQYKISITYETPEVNLVKASFNHKILGENLGISIDTINPTLPIMQDKISQSAFVTIKSLKALESVLCDFRKLKIFMKEHQLISCCLLVAETLNKKNDIHMRCFSPSVGVNEDPFTGSILGGLAAYVHHNHLLSENKKTFNVEQGHFLNRPGEVSVEYRYHHKKYHVKVHAKARHFFSTEIELINKQPEKNHESI